MLNKTIILNDNSSIPIIGLGTWQTPNNITAKVVEEAINVGYKHIDTANAYDNEEGVGLGIKNTKIARDQIYVTSKVPAEIKSYEEAKKKIDESLHKLNIDYIDLMLIHCPSPWPLFKKHINAIINKNQEAWKKYGFVNQNIEVYKALEEGVIAGKIRSIGISNFFNVDIQNILDHCSIKPVINQINYHIGYEQEDEVEFCHTNNIKVEAYSPIATGRLLENEKVIEIAKKYNVSVAQLSIRYALDKTDIVLPKTTHKEFMIQNANIDFQISDEDKATLAEIKEKPFANH